MTRRAGLRNRAVPTAGLLLLTACSNHAAPAPAPAAPATAAAQAGCPAVTVPGVTALLPGTPARTEAAVALAARFAAAYSTYRWNEPPGAYLSRLRPLVTRPLYQVLAQAAGAPAILAHRHSTQLAATAAVTGEHIRDLARSSVIITVQVRQAITSTAGTSTAQVSLAVTVVRRGSRWAVYDTEPASAGDQGGPADVPGAP